MNDDGLVVCNVWWVERVGPCPAAWQYRQLKVVCSHARRGARGVLGGVCMLQRIAPVVAAAGQGRLGQQRQRISAAAARPACGAWLHGPRRITRCPSVPRGVQARPPAPPRCATQSGVRAEARSAPRPTSPNLLRLRTRREGWRARRESLGRVSQRPHRSGEPCLQRVAGHRARRIRRQTSKNPAYLARSRFAVRACRFRPPRTIPAS